MSLDPKLLADIRKHQDTLATGGQLLSQVQLQGYYRLFRDRFGPEVLRNLDGEALLTTLHDHGNRDSLVYWLEFKNDPEFPAAFGRIGGGSALKFGIYRRKETGAWMAGSPQAQRELTLQEAIVIARRNRDQLLAGVEVLQKFPERGADEDYALLQRDMERAAPDVNDTAWGHKYFSLLFPDRLDDYHSPDYQRFHLFKLLQIPPSTSGRYAAAGRYVAIAAELNMPLNHLTTILNVRDGRPYRYWRIGTSNGSKPRNRWDLMRNNSLVAIGWAELGDLSQLDNSKASKDKLRELMETKRPNTPQAIGRAVAQVFAFVLNVQEGDLVLACDGTEVLGIGRIKQAYSYDPASDFPHRRAVDWLNLDEWKMPVAEGLQTTVYEMRKEAQNLVEAERRILDTTPLPPPVVPNPAPELGTIAPRLSDLAGRIQSILERKGQVILYGPPGTGKTYWALKTAHELAAYYRFGQSFETLTAEQKTSMSGSAQQSDGLVRLCSFHPAYGYEDFLEGYRPMAINDQLVFEQRDGVFKRLCEDAQRNPTIRYYLIIDEINRGDIPRIFGELLTVLEKDKRGNAILLPLSGIPFRVPENVYVIGTMNTADRSIALLDTALRRRFGFVELMPDVTVFGNATVKGIPLGPWLEALNQRICANIGRDARNLQIGHAYFLSHGQPVTDFARFTRIVQDDLLPLLEEYCYEDYDALEKILGTGLIDGVNQRVRHELFESARQDELITALLQPCPELSALPQVVTADTEQIEQTDADESNQIDALTA
jgi:5-methylcytosine-specific restriction protein B